jgi:hypothetical protein
MPCLCDAAGEPTVSHAGCEIQRPPLGFGDGALVTAGSYLKLATARSTVS